MNRSRRRSSHTPVAQIGIDRPTHGPASVDLELSGEARHPIQPLGGGTWFANWGTLLTIASVVVRRSSRLALRRRLDHAGRRRRTSAPRRTRSSARTGSDDRVPRASAPLAGSRAREGACKISALHRYASVGVLPWPGPTPQVQRGHRKSPPATGQVLRLLSSDAGAVGRDHVLRRAATCCPNAVLSSRLDDRRGRCALLAEVPTEGVYGTRPTAGRRQLSRGLARNRARGSAVRCAGRQTVGVQQLS